MKNTKNKCYPFLAELLNSLGPAEAEYNFLKHSAPLPLAFLLFPFSPNRGGGGIWQLLEYMFRICLLEQFSWSLDRNAFSLKDWNYELSEGIWINMRWTLGLCLPLLFCFSNKNKSELTKWLTGAGARMTVGFGGIPPVPCCDFTLLTKSNPQRLQVWVSHLPSSNSDFQLWWGSAQCGFLRVELCGSWKAADVPSSLRCACAFFLLRTSFIYCPALSSGWVSLCFISSLPTENTAVFHTSLMLMQALQMPSLPCKGSTAFHWAFKQHPKLFVSHHRTPSNFWKLH